MHKLQIIGFECCATKRARFRQKCTFTEGNIRMTSYHSGCLEAFRDAPQPSKSQRLMISKMRTLDGARIKQASNPYLRLTRDKIKKEPKPIEIRMYSVRV